MSDEAQQQKKLKKSAKPRAVQSSAQRGGVIDGATALPQVNLLPSSVRARRALQRVKVWLVIGLGVVLIAALLAYVFAMLSASSAEDELDEVRAYTQRLLTEQAKYSEVPVILAQAPVFSSSPSTRSGFVGGGISTPSSRRNPNRP